MVISFALLELIGIKYSDISEEDIVSLFRVTGWAKWMLKYALYGFFVCSTRDLFPSNISCHCLFINEVIYIKQRSYLVSEADISSETDS